MDKYYLPRHLDVPFKVAVWTLDEVFVFAVPFFMAFLLLDSPLAGILTGVLGVVMLKKMKGEEGHYFVLHLAWWYLPPFINWRATPPSHVRQLSG